MLQGGKYLVTGGSRGIGRAVVLELASAGCEIAFTYSTQAEAAQEVCAAAEAAGGRAYAFQANVSDLEQARHVIEQAREQLGGLDGLILNAGITRDRPLVMMPEESWDEVMTTNLKGMFTYARAAIYGFVQQRHGRIVVVSSVSGIMGVVGQTNYSATKAGQIGFVKSLAQEVAPYGITVNAVAPGFIETDIWNSIPEKKRKTILEQIPLGRLGQAQEVAASVHYLLSPAAAYVTGSVLVIDGGLSS